jgi:hypothetical protein
MFVNEVLFIAMSLLHTCRVYMSVQLFLLTFTYGYRLIYTKYIFSKVEVKLGFVVKCTLLCDLHPSTPIANWKNFCHKFIPVPPSRRLEKMSTSRLSRLVGPSLIFRYIAIHDNAIINCSIFMFVNSNSCLDRVDLLIDLKNQPSQCHNLN